MACKDNDVDSVSEGRFTYDIFGSLSCCTWGEVERRSTPDSFDVVIIGAGMHGAYLAAKLESYVKRDNFKILVLDAGAFLFPTHLHNLPSSFGSEVGRPSGLSTHGTAAQLSNVVWGLPWRSNTLSPGIAYCLGGRSLFWSGWSVPLTERDLRQWPAEMRRALLGAAGYRKTALEIGSNDSTDIIRHSALYKRLSVLLKQAAHGFAALGRLEEALLAVQASSPASGLFPFDQFSSITLLLDAVQRDRDRSRNKQCVRRLSILPRCIATRLNHSGGNIESIEVFVEGQRRTLALGKKTVIVLANSTIEASRIVLNSFSTEELHLPRPELPNLMAHMRSNITVRLRRKALGLSKRPQSLETAAFLLRGRWLQKSFHYQIWSAATGSANPLSNVDLLIPDLDAINEIVKNQSDQWVSISIRGMSEMEGASQASSEPRRRSRVSLSDDADEWGVRRASVYLIPTNRDEDLWREMNLTAIAFLRKLSPRDGDVQHWDPIKQSWKQGHADPEDLERFRLELGESHHEAGTLFSGAEGVTDINSRLHACNKIFVVGPAVFPTIGSANPSLTALTLTRRTAQFIALHS